MKKFQRTIAAIAAVATAISAMSIASFAEDAFPNEGESSVAAAAAVEGEGTFEGTVESIKYNMILPTVPAENTALYNFILDPQDLIRQTKAASLGVDAAAYEDSLLEAGKYLYFKHVDEDNGGAVSYKGESETLTAYNLSTETVKLTVEGTVEDITGLKFMGADALSAQPTVPEIKLAIAEGSGTVGTKGNFVVAENETVAKATHEVELAPVADTNFAISYADSKYSYDYSDTFKGLIADGGYKELTTGDTKVASASFKLIGSIANDEDGEIWGDYKPTENPSVKIIWSMADPAANAAPAVTLSNNEITYTEGALVIPYSLGKGDLAATKVESIKCKIGTYEGAVKTYTDANNTITIASGKNYTAGSTLTITFDNGDSVVVTVVEATP